MLKLFKKTLAVCLIGFGLRSTTCNITSTFRLVVCYWNYNSSGWNNMAFLLIEMLQLIIKKQRRVGKI